MTGRSLGLVTLVVTLFGTAATAGATMPSATNYAAAAPLARAAPRAHLLTAPAGWTRIATSTIAGESLRFASVAIPAPKDVWAIGYAFDLAGGAIQFFTLAEHLVGSRFRIVATPDVTGTTGPTADFLYGASGSSANNVWAVGTWTTPTDEDQALIEHWNGHAWAVEPSAQPGTANNFLDGVAARSPTDVWAVGASTNSGQFYERPMAEHWNGATWSAVSVPNPAWCSGHSLLTAVTAVSATDAFAVGWCESAGSGPNEAFVERWTGKAWALVEGKENLPKGSQLNGVSASSQSNVWAVGDSQRPGNYPPIPMTIHFDGKSWTLAKVSDKSALDLNAVVATEAGTWAVGAGLSPEPPFAGPLSVKLVDGAWSPVTVPLSFGSLSGVGIDESTHQAWAVGLSPGSGGNDVPVAFMTEP